MYANQLDAHVPTQLGTLRNLRSLDIHDNNLTGRMPAEVCQLRKGNLEVLIADCLGQKKEVKCDCCTLCCEGLPNMRCVDMATQREVIVGLESQQTKK